MASFDWKKNIEDCIKVGLIITANILCIKGGKCKTTKGVYGCHGYYETCWWNSRWCPC